jgi:hypothetical protein
MRCSRVEFPMPEIANTVMINSTISENISTAPRCRNGIAIPLLRVSPLIVSL